MDLDSIQDSLLDNKKVAAVVCREDKIYESKSYMFLIDCEISVLDRWIPIIIGIPSNWGQALVDIYIEDKTNFPFIPHIDIKGKICLFDLEGVLIDQNLCGLLNQCIERAIYIIIEGLLGKNRNDFLEEFDLYWCQLSEIKNMKLCIPKEKRTQRIYYSEHTVARRKKEKYINYLQRMKKSWLFASFNSSDFVTWNIEGTRKNGIYICVKSPNIIFPPDARKRLDIDYFNNLFKLANTNEISNIINKLGKDKVIVFEVIQPNGISSFLGGIFRNASFSKNEDNKFIIESTGELQPILVSRIDKNYLMSRTSEEKNVLTDKKYLIIGCGSIGGYVINEMVNAGCEDITLVDRDFLKEENIFRHLLGIEYVDKYKAEALTEYFNKNILGLKLKPLDEEVENLVVGGDIDFSDFDIIISAVGNHNVNRWINRKLIESSIDIPTIYAWNEPLDIGCHVAYIKLGNFGCYDCLFKRDKGTNELYDATAYSKQGQTITKNLTGCGGSFIPYGSTVSLKTSMICIDLMKKVISDRCCENILLSSKGEGYYYEKSGLIPSEIYKNQKESTLTISGRDFVRMNCEICGEKNDV